MRRILTALILAAACSGAQAQTNPSVETLNLAFKQASRMSHFANLWARTNADPYCQERADRASTAALDAGIFLVDTLQGRDTERAARYSLVRAKTAVRLAAECVPGSYTPPGEIVIPFEVGGR